MLKKYKEYLEWNDLLQLHIQYDEEFNGNINKNERGEFPVLNDDAKSDLWSEAIENMSTKDIVSTRNIYTKIINSNMSNDGKKWWKSILSLAMDAPLEELERLLKSNSSVNKNNMSTYVIVAANQFIENVASVERERRKKEENEDNERLKQFQKNAEQCKKKKENAEQNLRRHREMGDRS